MANKSIKNRNKNKNIFFICFLWKFTVKFIVKVRNVNNDDADAVNAVDAVGKNPIKSTKNNTHRH